MDYYISIKFIENWLKQGGSGCGEDKPKASSTANVTPSATSAPETDAPVVTEEVTAAPAETVAPDETASAPDVKPTATPDSKNITILAKNGKPTYAVYRDKWAEDVVISGGIALCDAIKQKTGVQLQYSTDDDAGKIKDMKEILIGNTNRPVSDEAMKGLTENQFRFFCKDGLLAILLQMTASWNLLLKSSLKSM